MRNRSSAFLFVFLTFGLVLGCTRSGQGSAPSALPTVSSNSPTSLPATAAQLPTQGQGNCVAAASFLQDLTVADGSRIQPGERVDKRWSVANNGSCDWGLGYRLIPQEPNPFVSGRETALYPAKAGTNAVWRVTFAAPQEAGEYIGSWQAYNPEGQPFGDPVFVLIEVVGDGSQDQAQDSE